MKRIFGLDLLRSLAIIIVLISHSGILIQNFTAFPYIPLPDGVDLFFVLSGYLVGGLFLRQIETDGGIHLSAMFTFIMRRWFRTLPNYFLFLLLNIVLIYFGLLPGTLNKYLVTYFLFLQNFFKPYDFLFWESWSLAVEEWFYLLLPFILFSIFKISRSKISIKNTVLFTCLVFILLSLIYRISQANEALDTDLYYRKLVLTRLDTIGYGVLAAYCHAYFADRWNKYKNGLFILGIMAIAFLLTVDFENMFFTKTFYYSITALSIAFLLPKLESLKTEPFRFKPFEFISRISYSMYLVHLPVLFLLTHFISVTAPVQGFVTYLLFWVITLLTSYLIYRFYELPFMNLRDTRKPILNK